MDLKWWVIHPHLWSRQLLLFADDAAFRERDSSLVVDQIIDRSSDRSCALLKHAAILCQLPLHTLAEIMCVCRASLS